MIESSDLDILNAARNKCMYYGKKNSIVEWTLSDEWVTVKPQACNLSRGRIEAWKEGYPLLCNFDDFDNEFETKF